MHRQRLIWTCLLHWLLLYRTSWQASYLQSRKQYCIPGQQFSSMVRHSHPEIFTPTSGDASSELMECSLKCIQHGACVFHFSAGAASNTTRTAAHCVCYAYPRSLHTVTSSSQLSPASSSSTILFNRKLRATCPDFMVDGGEYFVIRTVTKPANALRKCLSKGGRLAHLDSASSLEKTFEWLYKNRQALISTNATIIYNEEDEDEEDDDEEDDDEEDTTQWIIPIVYVEGVQVKAPDSDKEDEILSDWFSQFDGSPITFEDDYVAAMAFKSKFHRYLAVGIALNATNTDQMGIRSFVNVVNANKGFVLCQSAP